MQIRHLLRRAEHERAGAQHVRQRARIVLPVGPDLGDGDVAGRLDELAELPVGDRRAIDPEAVDAHLMRRRLLRIVPVGAHAERAALDPHHPRRGIGPARGHGVIGSSGGALYHGQNFRGRGSDHAALRSAIGTSANGRSRGMS
jgi:hypothetical protein